MQKRVLLLTGNPGIGKTTVLLKAVEALKAEGLRVGGMVSREVRNCGSRVGFEILDLGNGRRGWLAHVSQKSGPSIGKYRVNLEDLEGVGVSAIMKAVESLDIVAIDEIGPMELFSQKFEDSVKKAIQSSKVVVGVIHWKARDELIDRIKSREDVAVYVVTYENRGKLHEDIVQRVRSLHQQ